MTTPANPRKGWTQPHMFSTRKGHLVCLITPEHAKQDLLRLACKNTDAFLKKQPWQTESGAPAPHKLGVLTSGDQGRRFANLFHWKDRASVRHKVSV